MYTQAKKLCSALRLCLSIPNICTQSIQIFTLQVLITKQRYALKYNPLGNHQVEPQTTQRTTEPLKSKITTSIVCESVIIQNRSAKF